MRMVRISEVVLNHHERLPGSGYPGKIKDLSVDPKKYVPGKKGKGIPLSARIVSIADVFDPELVGIFVKMGDTLDAIKRNLP